MDRVDEALAASPNPTQPKCKIFPSVETCCISALSGVVGAWEQTTSSSICTLEINEDKKNEKKEKKIKRKRPVLNVNTFHVLSSTLLLEVNAPTLISSVSLYEICKFPDKFI